MNKTTEELENENSCLKLRLNPLPKPKVVCLCGSTRYWKVFEDENMRLTLEGNIVLSVGVVMSKNNELFGSMPPEQVEQIRKQLDYLHKRKIDLADEVRFLNVNGYMGESTRNELAYSRAMGKTISFLEPYIVDTPVFFDISWVRNPVDPCAVIDWSKVEERKS
jgi:hypothetical protein